MASQGMPRNRPRSRVQNECGGSRYGKIHKGFDGLDKFHPTAQNGEYGKRNGEQQQHVAGDQGWAVSSTAAGEPTGPVIGGEHATTISKVVDETLFAPDCLCYS